MLGLCLAKEVKNRIDKVCVKQLQDLFGNSFKVTHLILIELVFLLVIIYSVKLLRQW